MRRLLSLIGCLPLLAACIAAPSVFQGDKAGPLLTLPDSAGVIVGPIESIDDEEAEALRAGLVEAFLAANLPATTGAGNVASWSVAAAVLPPDDAGAGATPTIWELRDGEGRLLRAFKRPLDLSPLSSAEPAEERVRRNRAQLAEVARTVSVLMRAGAAAPFEADPPPKVRVLPVTGLDERDRHYVTTAMRTALVGRGVEPAEEREPEALLLFGDIATAPEGDAARRVEIVWTLTRADGVEIGTARQSNRVPEEELAQGWGTIAPLVAEAVVDGILALIDEARAPR